MAQETSDTCPQCRRLFVGAIEVRTMKIEGIATVVCEETPDRNWIQCDSCGLVICKSCCLDAGSGFCNTCLKPPQIAVSGTATA